MTHLLPPLTLAKSPAVEQSKYMNKKIVIICVGILVLAGIVTVLLLRMSQSSRPTNTRNSNQNVTAQTNLYLKQMGGEKTCKGEGPITFTHPPMKPEDVGIVLPYGLLAGGHVTPIDHMYFSPKDFNSKADTYPVYGIADGTIATIQFRPDNTPSGQTSRSGKKGDYRLDIYYNCTFYSYYDLITSLSPELAAKVPTDTSKHWSERVNIPIKAGQEIGKIGGQTLDWAVYNAQAKLTGYISPELYAYEPWKIYTDYKSLDYFAEPYKSQFYGLLARKVEPRSGKIDYDVDGKLVGNWFLENSNGYGGNTGSNMQYWDGHLAIVPDYIDPDLWHFSIGKWTGKKVGNSSDSAQQFGIAPNPNPREVDVTTGAFNYELRETQMYDGDTGQIWMATSPISNPKGRISGSVFGVARLQLLEARKLKVELFPEKTASQVSDFTSNAKIYVR